MVYINNVNNLVLVFKKKSAKKALSFLKNCKKARLKRASLNAPLFRASL